jgi:hypothetical protein
MIWVPLFLFFFLVYLFACLLIGGLGFAYCLPF